MLKRWIADLESTDRKVRRLALQELEKLGPVAREAVPALTAALQKAQDDWNLLPGRTLEQWNREHCLKKTYDDWDRLSGDAAVTKGQGDWEMIPDLARTLAAIGPDARAAVPLLVHLVDPSGAYMWEGAAPAFAILRIGSEPSEERLAVRSLLRVSFPRSTGMDEDEVLAALARQVPLDRIRPYLMEELCDVRSRGGAVAALAHYGVA